MKINFFRYFSAFQKSQNDNSGAWNESNKLRARCFNNDRAFDFIQSIGVYYVETAIKEYLKCDLFFVTIRM